MPRYVQLAGVMRTRIARGMWPRQHRLPSLESLMAEFGVARVTVRQAVDLLAREGLVSPQQGRGTFVTGEPERSRIINVVTRLDELARVYDDTQPRIVIIEESVTLPPQTLAEGEPAPSYAYMRRVHLREGRPYCVIDIHLDAEVFARHPTRFRKETVIPLLMAMPSVRIVAARQVLTISTADLEVAHHLQISVNAPVADVRRVLTGPKRRVIYLAEVTYRGDFVHVEFDLKA